MNWIRVATKMKGDPRVGAIAAACKVRVEHAVGLVCCALMEFPDHARDGDIAAVPDVVLEQWALWSGKAGVFAAAFRAQLCDERGVVRAWEKHNGAAIRKADADVQRKRSAAEAQKTARDPGAGRAEVARKSRGNLRDGGAASEVDGTLRTPTTAADAAAAGVARAPEPPAAAASADPDPGDGYVLRKATMHARFVDERHRLALDRHLRASGNPLGVLLDLEAAAAERPSDGAPGVPWDVLGTVLHEMAQKGVRPTEFNLRSWAKPLLKTAAVGGYDDDEPDMLAKVGL